MTSVPLKDLLNDIVSPPTLLAGVAVLLAALQGMLALESADPCRLSTRKMNFILVLEALELSLLIASEIYSFVELRKALKTSLIWLRWTAPCLLAAGLIGSFVDAYFTLAIVAKSRIAWLPMSSLGDPHSCLALLPFSITTAGAIVLLGWRLGWWFKLLEVDSKAANMAALAEKALSQGAFGFAVGWALAISSGVLILVMLCDIGEDGPNYIASLPFLWSPDEWLGENSNTNIRVIYREPSDTLLRQFEAAAMLDASLPSAGADEASVKKALLQRQLLHVGNAIVGEDQQRALKEESSSADTMHRVILIAEHLTVLPLLFIIIAAIARMHRSADKGIIKVLQQFADAVIVLSFVELALGIKNTIWGVRGNTAEERAIPSEPV